MKIDFVPNGRGKARNPPDPDYPDGVELDLTEGKPGEWVELVYPAPECGMWVISDPRFGEVIVTAAGRADDPRRVKLPYKKQERVV